MRCLALLALGTWAVAGQTVPTTDLLKKVESRYNSTKTLQASFTQILTERGRPHLPQKGTLYLSKPDRTRWEYTDPAGDLFVSDGKFTYQYDKEANTVTRTPFKQEDDMRVALSFLLGDLNFQKDFEEFRDSGGSDHMIEMLPRNKKLAFSKIILVVASDASIRRVTIVSPEGLSMQYALEGEQRNLKLPLSLFEFHPPPGAQMVEEH